jgi:hypothetical protein
MYTDTGNHGPSLQLMNCGHQLPGRPSMGAWVTYGLGTENRNLPGSSCCVGLSGAGLVTGARAACRRFTRGYTSTTPRSSPRSWSRSCETQLSRKSSASSCLLGKLNQRPGTTGSQPQLESAMQSMESAYRLQSEAMDVFDIRRSRSR